MSPRSGEFSNISTLVKQALDKHLQEQGIDWREEEGEKWRLPSCRGANPNCRLKSIVSLILATVMVILVTGWEKEDTMNATACCEGEELTYCEELCIFATEDKAKTEEPETF